MNCQLYSGVSVSGKLQHFEPAVAVITNFHQGTTSLCQECFDWWLDSADEDESLEPKAIRFLKRE